MTKNNNFTTLLWDVDGTLIDTTAIIVNSLRQVFRESMRMDISSDKLRALIGIPVHEQMTSFGDPSDFGSSVDDMERAMIGYYEQQRSQERPIQEAIEALIRGKRGGLRTALVTSKNDVELEHTLPRLAISAYCDAIVGADQVAPYYKPHPRPVQLALKLLGVSDPTEALFIGDSVHDMRSGRAAGVETAAVLWGAAPADALRAEEPDYIFARPQELLEFVETQLLGPVAAYA